MRSAVCAQSSATRSRTRRPSTRKTANLSTRARRATTHASDWACGRQGEEHSPEHARMTSDHTRLLPKAEGDTCSLPTYKKCSHTVRSGSSVHRGPGPLTRLAAVVSVRYSPGDSLFRFAKTNIFGWFSCKPVAGPRARLDSEPAGGQAQPRSSRCAEWTHVNEGCGWFAWWFAPA